MQRQKIYGLHLRRDLVSLWTSSWIHGQSKRGSQLSLSKSKIRYWSLSRFLVSDLFTHFFFPEITYLNPDAYRVVSFCNECHLIIFWELSEFWKINVIIAVTIFGEWLSWRRAMDCSNNIMLWFIWCAQEFSTANKVWHSWYERAPEWRKQFDLCLGET